MIQFSNALNIGIFLLLISSAKCVAQITSNIAHQAINDIQVLSADNMGGRMPGQSGHQLAADYLVARFSALNLKHFGHSFIHEFEYKNGWKNVTGKNVIGWIEGVQQPDSYIVITAHYDHLGNTGRKIFNGADDNASGVAVLMALASYFTSHPPKHSVIFLATDAEETGLHGADAFLERPSVLHDQIKLNINIDMVGNGGRRHQLFILTSKNSLTYSTFVREYSVTHSTSQFRIKAGQPINIDRSRPAGNNINWRKASDHASFAKYDIPYVYFGNDVHKHYHQESDTFENIDIEFFKKALRHIGQISIIIDNHL